MHDPNKITYFGETDFRGKKVSFGIKAEDRSRHVYVIGKTGMGKSTLLENMAAQDIKNGEGLCFIDPHGSAIDVLLDYIPEERIGDVVYFAPFDSEHPISFNILETVPEDQRHLVVQGLMSTFDKIWPDTFSERMRYILSNTLLALLEYPGSTLLGVNRMYSDKGYREEVVRNITDPTVKAFWEDEFAKWDERFMREATAAIQNKIGQFTANPLVRNIVGQKTSSFDFREIMDDKKILLINLSKGRIGEQNSGLLGGMLITKIYLAAMSRADLSKSDMNNLPPFYLFVDEFQNFANESFADILAEARKYKLNLTMAHQYIDQMEEEVRDAVFGNVGTTIAFRVGPIDAEMLEKIFLPTFTVEDIVNLGKFQLYLTLMIDGVGSKPFSATSLPPLLNNSLSYREEVIEYSRNSFSKPREEIQKYIQEWYKTEFHTEKQKKEITKKEEYLKDKFGQEYKPRDNRSEDDEYAGAFVEKKVEKVKRDFPVQSKDKPYKNPKELTKINISKDIKEVLVEKGGVKEVPKEIPKQISLNNLAQNVQKPKISHKDPSNENKSLLKDALSRALKNSKIQQQLKDVKINQPGIQKTESDFVDIDRHIVSRTKDEDNQGKGEGKSKEVPEDVLKSILE